MILNNLMILDFLILDSSLFIAQIRKPVADLLCCATIRLAGIDNCCSVVSLLSSLGIEQLADIFIGEIHEVNSIFELLLSGAEVLLQSGKMDGVCVKCLGPRMD